MTQTQTQIQTHERHSVYLAVPGHNYCWGTVTGIVNASDRHEVRPFTGGFGFSGQEDFNMLWADAHNLYDEGVITHFAMLHGDITPDTSQRWLDILLEEMDARNASLVSAVSPIKDGRGLTSSGICDLNDSWRPYRRFTVREIHQRLPETFDHAAAGYPNQPLLHNTGCFVVDLRKPVFRAAGEGGALDLYFHFPTRAVRGKSGKWEHQRESEDWHFSRQLWDRGVRDTYITRRVRLAHHGKLTYHNHGEWGSHTDGDDDTADKWRAAEDAKPLRMLQMLEFELGDRCNMAHLHPKCPTSSPERWELLQTTRALDDDTIVRCAVEAYRDLGFDGLVGWIYYNEPLLQADRMFRLMDRIRQLVPTARFILWTNGTLIPEECERFQQFEQIVVTNHGPDSIAGSERLLARQINHKVMPGTFDDRLHQIQPADCNAPCLRPFVELIIDHYGNSHLCCYEWRGRATLGNVWDGFASVAAKWRSMLPLISGHRMAADAPAACRECGHRWDKYQLHDEAIVERARRWRQELQEIHEPHQQQQTEQAGQLPCPAASQVSYDESGCAMAVVQ